MNRASMHRAWGYKMKRKDFIAKHAEQNQTNKHSFAMEHINPLSAETFLYPFLGGKGSFLTPGDIYGNKYKSIVQYSTQKILKNHKICTLYEKHKRDMTLMSYMSL